LVIFYISVFLSGFRLAWPVLESRTGQRLWLAELEDRPDTKKSGQKNTGYNYNVDSLPKFYIKKTKFVRKNINITFIFLSNIVGTDKKDIHN
jgi:hypothetical protein